VTNMRAVYRDKEGRTYSCPVAVHEGQWQMQTSAGFQPITFYFDDDVAGRLTFVNYRKEPIAEDSRLHISRLPGESNFGALQRAYAEKEIVEQRKQRQAARSQIQNIPLDPTRVAAARDLNNESAKTMRPRGGGVGLSIPQGLSQAEIETALKNRR